MKKPVKTAKDPSTPDSRARLLMIARKTVGKLLRHAPGLQITDIRFSYGLGEPLVFAELRNNEKDVLLLQFLKNSESPNTIEVTELRTKNAYGPLYYFDFDAPTEYHLDMLTMIASCV